MNKIIAIAFAAILAVLAISCQKENISIEQSDEPVQYTFDISVNEQVGFDDDATTKGGTAPSYKTAWASGDRIFLFFKPASGSLLADTYATLTYNGSTWDGGVNGSSSLGDAGTLSAVYVYKLDSNAKPEFSDGQWTIVTGNTFYNCQAGVSYTVSGTKEISASLSLEAPADFVRFSIYGTGDKPLTCDKVKGWKDVTIGSDMTFSNSTCTVYMEGFENSGNSSYKDFFGRIVGGGTSLEGINCNFSMAVNGKVHEHSAAPTTDARSFSMDANTWTKAPGKLPGLFKVSKGADNKEGTEDDVMVCFSQGNLWYGPATTGATKTFNFEANQYDSTPSSNGDWDASHVSHFFWSKNPSVAYAATYSDSSRSESDVFFTNANDFKVNVDGEDQTDWRTLSKDEWGYLFGMELSSVFYAPKDDHPRAGKFGLATVNSRTGLVLLPDSWNLPSGCSFTATALDGDCNVTDGEGFALNTYTLDQWSLMESAGAVFLPAAGYNDESYIGSVGVEGRYWSSSAYNNSYQAYEVSFISNLVCPDNYDMRYYGRSVRLITECQ